MGGWALVTRVSRRCASMAKGGLLLVSLLACVQEPLGTRRPPTSSSGFTTDAAWEPDLAEPVDLIAAGMPDARDAGPDLGRDVALDRPVIPDAAIDTGPMPDLADGKTRPPDAALPHDTAGPQDVAAPDVAVTSPDLAT